MTVSGSAASTLVEAIAQLASVAGADVADSSDGGSHLVVHLADGRRVLFDIAARAHPETHEIGSLVRARADGGNNVILVADRLTAAARREVVQRGASFFDRRGRIVLVLDGRTIEADVEPADRPKRRVGGSAIRGVSGLSLAFASLLRVDEAARVNQVARASGLTGAAISQARTKLRAAHLLDDRYRPIVPDLFDALVQAWHWPAEVEGRIPNWNDRLAAAAGAQVDGPFLANIGALDDAIRLADPTLRDGLAGWALTGTHAAAAYGASAVIGSAAPLQVIVPEDRFLAATKVANNPAMSAVDSRPARLLAAPTALAVRLRRRSADGVPLAHPLVVAVDLARDPARGREILATFDPPGVDVVWR